MTQSNPSFAVSINPTNGEEIARHPYLNAAEIEQLLFRAEAGSRDLAATPVPARSALMLNMAGTLRRHVDELASMAALEMGKPIAQGRAEVEKCATLCDWCAEHGPGILSDEATSIGPNAYISYLPIGPVLGIQPWNFPFWQVLRGAAGILFGGNAYVLKHAPNVLGCAYLLERLWREAGLPDGAFSVLNVTTDCVPNVIGDSRIAAVVVTGSVRAGAAIASLAGSAVKKTVLELGGSDPFIVLRDADVDAAVAAAVAARFQNTGQICIAAKRIILDAPIAAAFTTKFTASVASLPIGEPQDERTYIGPMARADLRDELSAQVQRSQGEGAETLLGGHSLPGRGNYFAPTVLAAIKPGMTVFREETFGPVAALVVADDPEQAVRLANDSDYGLNAAIWTADKSVARALARRLHVGGVFINGYSASDPRVPIGGVKKSGYGRELSAYGIREFLNAQVVWTDRT
jgi:succinate-semialdehyde dehydrogenase